MVDSRASKARPHITPLDPELFMPRKHITRPAFATALLQGLGLGALAASVALAGPPAQPVPTGVPKAFAADITPEMYKALDPCSQERLTRLAALVESGRDLPMGCFAPDTPNEIVQAFERVFHRQIGQRYDLGPRWEATALDPSSTGIYGTPTILTFGIIADGTLIPDGTGEGDAPSNLQARMDAIYGSRDTWVNLLKQMFARWGEVTGITYVFEPNDDGSTLADLPGEPGVRADLRIGGKAIDGNSGILAYNYYPQVGDMVIDTSDNFFEDLTNNSIRLRNVLWHEHGHGMGLAHSCPIARLKLMEPFVQVNFEGPQVDDVRASQRMYGDTNEPNGSSGAATNMGEVPSSSTLVIGNPGPIKAGSTVGLHDSTDIDWYQITFAQAGFASFTLNPVGYNYDAESQSCGGESGSCCFGSPTRGNEVLNPSMEIRRSPSGPTIGTGFTRPGGFSETVQGVKVSAGDTFYIRVFSESTPAIEDCLLYTVAITQEEPLLLVIPDPAQPSLVRVGLPLQVKARIGPGRQPLAAGSERVLYRLKGTSTFNAIPLALDEGDTYTGFVPMGTCGQVTEYYFEAKTTSGSAVRAPATAPVAFFTATAGNPFPIPLFSDSFDTDKGWTVSNAAVPADAPPGSVFDGGWERGIPAGKGQRFDPSYDADDNSWAAMTANRLGNSDVDWGPTWWTSPTFNLSSYAAATLNFSYWFRSSAVDPDQFTVELSSNNGSTWTVALRVVGDDVRGWVKRSIRLDEFIPMTGAVRIRFAAVDLAVNTMGEIKPANNTTVEAGVDDVQLFAHDCTSACPCPADADGSGGTPDVTDIDAFFAAWLNGEVTADADCSGGTPDVTDIDIFFIAWLNGGC
jgi:hypothetical protein